MIADWTSYQLADFVPYGPEVYLRLIARVGESYWPLHGLMLLAGLALLILAVRGRGRIACLLLAGAWAWVGWGFFLQHYAELNVAGRSLGGAFFAQALLLLLIAGIGGPAVVRPASPVIRMAAGLLALGGLLAYPLIGLYLGDSRFQAETFGLHPDPTVVVTLGIALLALRGPTLLVAVTLPVLWGILSGLHRQVLELALWWLPLALSLGAFVASIWTFFADQRWSGDARQAS